MKTILSAGFIFLLGLTMPGAAAAQNIPDARMAKVMELMRLTGTEAMMINMANTVIPTALQTERKAHPEVSDAFWDEYASVFQTMMKAKTPDLLQEIAAIYAAEFSEDEIDALVAFYQTPAGAKMIHEVPTILQQSVQIGQRWGKEIGTEAARQTLENLRRKNSAP